MTLKETIEALLRIQEKSSDSFLGKIISKIEKAFFSKILKFIDKAKTKDKKFDVESEDANKELLIEIGEEIDDSYINSGIKDELDTFLKEFGLVEKLTKEIYRKTLTDVDPTELTDHFRNTRVFKTRIVDSLTKGLLNKSVFQTQVTDELRDELFDAIVFGKSVKETKDLIRSKVISDKTGNSTLRKYASQIANDAVTGYTGALQDATRAKYDLDAFSFLGSIVKDSRCNCVNATCTSRHPKFDGKFDRFKLKDRKGFRYEDLDKILAIAEKTTSHTDKNGRKHKNNEGYNDAVTPETFAQYRFGYNCRHQVIYWRMSDEEKAESQALDRIISD